MLAKVPPGGGCPVAGAFVGTYICRSCIGIYYKSVLNATGPWADVERELRTGLQITYGASQGLHGVGGVEARRRFR